MQSTRLVSISFVRYASQELTALPVDVNEFPEELEIALTTDFLELQATEAFPSAEHIAGFSKRHRQ